MPLFKRSYCWQSWRSPEQTIDLSNCSAILAHFISCDGQVIYEKTAGDFAQFQQQAIKTTEELKQYCYTQREKMRQMSQRWGV